MKRKTKQGQSSKSASRITKSPIGSDYIQKENTNSVSNSSAESTKRDQLSPVTPEFIHGSTRSRSHRSTVFDEETNLSPPITNYPARGRRGRNSKKPNASEVPKSFADDHCSESRNLDDSIRAVANSESELQNDDDVAPEVSNDQMDLNTVNTTFAEPRQSDKASLPSTHIHRKVNKRELKALLKQTKKNRSILDENILAEMDKLASDFKGNCLINTEPHPVRPTPVAPYPIPPEAGKRGLGTGRRLGRRTRGRRGALVQRQIHHIPASWVPLILPNPAQMSTKPTKSYTIDCPDVDVDSLIPWLKGLNEARVHRYVTNMRRILSPLTARICQTSSTNIFVDAMRELGIGKNNCFESTQPSVSVVSKHFPSISFPQSNTTSSFLMSNSTFVTQKTESSFPPSYPSVGTGPSTFPQIAAAPTLKNSGRAIRGRGRGRHHFVNRRGDHLRKVVNSRVSSDPEVLSTSDTNVFGTRVAPESSASLHHDSGVSVSPTTPINPVVARQNSRTASASKAKSRVSRELRGLVTWDAVMAEQRRRQQEQEQVSSSDLSREKILKDYDPATAVATDMLAAIEEEDTTTSRARRTRQSSGSILSQTSHSFVGSETASIQTTIAASDPVSSDIHYRHKPGETSSTIRSEASVGTSSVSSEQHHVPIKTTKSNSSDGPKDFRTLPKRSSDDQLNSRLNPVQGSPSIHDLNYSAVDPNPSCLAKYSPISIDQDQLFQHNPNQLSGQPETVKTKTDDILKTPLGRRKDRKRKISKVTKTSDGSHHSDVSVPIELEIFPAVTLEPSEKVDMLSQPLSTPNTKRRRCAQSTSHLTSLSTSGGPHISNNLLLDGLKNESAAADSNSNLQNEDATFGNSSRRTATARSSALPPRKRYKVEIDNTALDLSPALVEEMHLGTAKSTKLDNNHVYDIIDLSKDADPKSNATSSHGNEVQQRKRGRGRPCRRIGNVTHPVDILVELPQPVSEFNVVSGERPKREAADFGFANLVAANLNNSSMVPNCSAESTVNRANAPTPNAVATDSSIEAPLPLSCPLPTLPRGRGRPPKPKLAASSTADTTIKDSLLQPTTGKTQIMNQLFDCIESTTEPIPNADQKECVLETSSCNTQLKAVLKDNQTEAKIVDHPQLSQPVNDLVSKVKIKHTSGITKAPRGRPSKLMLQARLNSQVSDSKPEEECIRTDDVLPVSKPPRDGVNFNLSVEVSNGLPSRASLFRGSRISDEINFHAKRDWPYSGPTYELFLRFLNEPDPAEPEYRLCAPIVYLPAPERFPEFYRFLIASSVSGLGCIVRFGELVLDRLFSTSESSPKFKDQDLALVEFPSLCIASIAGRFVSDFTQDSVLPNALRQLEDKLKLSDVEHSILAINASNLEVGVPLLDAAIEGVLNAWEAFAGRRSWLGRRVAQLKCAYTSIRNEFVMQYFGSDVSQSIAPIKICSSIAPNWKNQSSNTKKKNDRRALERGAEVIRCLCGFRVEGGHVMVQCDRCSSWQHLPCLWWALSLATREESGKHINSAVSTLCRTALLAAQAVGTGDFSDLSLNLKNEGVEAPYFCPVCLNLDDLTKEYPRSLSAAMSINSLDSVFSLQDATVDGEHEFWTLATPDGSGQIQTDDYAFVHRSWLDYSPVPASALSCKHIASKSTPEDSEYVIETAYDRVVVRIYRLWKDTSGVSWFEGGLFLRPYDLPKRTDLPDLDDACLWHLHEVIYDEASRIILPLKAWSGRCIVLSPSAYRAGCPADLVFREELDQFLPQLKGDRTTSTEDTESIGAIRLSFVCDKLFERTNAISEGGANNYRLEEISPGYLKVNMKPYCFLRKPEIQFGRAVLQRNFTAFQLMERDKSVILSNNNGSSNKELSCEKTSNHSDDSTKAEVTVSCANHKKPKGEKLARVVDWLERKLQTCPADTDPTDLHNSDTLESHSEPPKMQSKVDEASTSLASMQNPLSRASRGRGRTSRSSQSISLVSTINPVSETPLPPNTNYPLDKNSVESLISGRSKRLKFSSKENDSSIDQPQTCSDTPLLSVSPSINNDPEPSGTTDLNTVASAKSENKELLVTDTARVGSPSQMTSPLSSSDDQFGASQPKGSSRKRKRSITRKCIALNHIREESADLHLPMKDNSISGDHTPCFDEIKPSVNNSTPSLDHSVPLTSTESRTLQHSYSFLVYDEELILDSDTVHTSEELAQLSSHPETCFMMSVVSTSCLAVSRQPEVKNQEMLEVVTHVHVQESNIVAELEPVECADNPSPSHLNDTIENAKSQQTVEDNSDRASQCTRNSPTFILLSQPDRKLSETSFSVENVLLNDREITFYDKTSDTSAKADEPNIASADGCDRGSLSPREVLDTTVLNKVSEAFSSVATDAESQNLVIDQNDISSTNSPKEDVNLIEHDLDLNNVTNSASKDYLFLHSSGCSNTTDSSQGDDTIEDPIKGSENNLDRFSTEVSDFHASDKSRHTIDAHNSNEAILSHSSSLLDENFSEDSSPLTSDPVTHSLNIDHTNSPNTITSSVHDTTHESHDQECSFVPAQCMVDKGSPKIFDSTHTQIDVLNTNPKFDQIPTVAELTVAPQIMKVPLALDISKSLSCEILSDRIQPFDLVTESALKSNVEAELDNSGNKTCDNISPQNSVSPDSTAVVILDIQSEPSPMIDIRSTTENNLSVRSVPESLTLSSSLDLDSTNIEADQSSIPEALEKNLSSAHECNTPLDVSHSNGNTPLLDEPASSGSVIDSVSSSTIPEYLCCASGSFTPILELTSTKVESTVQNTESEKSKTPYHSPSPNNLSKTNEESRHHSHHRSHYRHHHNSRDSKRYSSSNPSSTRSEKSSHEHHSHKPYNRRDDRHHSKSSHRDDRKSSRHSSFKPYSRDPSPSSYHKYRDRSHSSSSRSSHHRYHDSCALSNHLTCDNQTRHSTSDFQRSAINLPKNEALNDFVNEKESYPNSSSSKQP